MVTGDKARERIQSERWSCGCCGREVGVNSVLCTECNKLCHKQCSGLTNPRGVRYFVYPRGAREGRVVMMETTRVEEVEQFCYLGDVLDCEAVEQEW